MRAVELEAGVFALARTAYPDVRDDVFVPVLDAMADGVRPELLGCEPPVAVERLTRHLFVRMGFRGNREDYNDPDNSYFNRVLERRTGMPIALSVLLILVARRLGLPVVGVGMPTHFIAKYRDDEHEIFIDAFDGGRTFSRADANLMLVQTGFGFQPQFLEPVGETAMLVRMVRNLVVIYTQRQDVERLKVLQRFAERLRDA